MDLYSKVASLKLRITDTGKNLSCLSVEVICRVLEQYIAVQRGLCQRYTVISSSSTALTFTFLGHGTKGLYLQA